MLIEFKVSNFRSFRTMQTFSMVAGSYAEHLNSHTMEPGPQGLARLLRTAAVYGPNAAGKTNLLRAMKFMQDLVVNAGVRAPGPLTQPFKFSVAARQAPSTFEVAFVQNGLRYEYGFTLDAARVREEWLMEYVNPRGRLLFERTYDEARGEYDWQFSSYLKGQKAVWSESTRPDTLFLSTATQLNSLQLVPVFEWFQKRLVVIVDASAMNASLTLSLLETPQGKARVLPFLRDADLNIADVEIRRETIPAGSFVAPGDRILEARAGGPANLIQVLFSHPGAGDEGPVTLEFGEESRGTQALFATAGAWLNVLEQGEVLLVDELETSLHPVIVRALIGKFHSARSNPAGAQLIFTTHNLSLLDAGLFRRDQIWFVDKEGGSETHLYPLSEFRPRNDEALERGYLRGRFGALPFVQDEPA